MKAIKPILYILLILSVFAAIRALLSLGYYALDCTSAACKEFGTIIIYILSFVLTLSIIYIADRLKGDKRKTAFIIIALASIVINIIFR